MKIFSFDVKKHMDIKVQIQIDLKKKKKKMKIIFIFFKFKKEPIYPIYHGLQPARGRVQERGSASHSGTQTGLVSWPPESQQVSVCIQPE